MTYPDWLFPIVNRYYMPLEGKWYAKGKDTCVPDPAIPYDCGVKPEDGSPAQKLQALYDKGVNEPDEANRHEIVWEAIQINIDEGPFIIGISGDQPMPIVVKDYMRNILDYGVVGPWAPATPGNQIACAVVDGQVNSATCINRFGMAAWGLQPQAVVIAMQTVAGGSPVRHSPRSLGSVDARGGLRLSTSHIAACHAPAEPDRPQGCTPTSQIIRFARTHA